MNRGDQVHLVGVGGVGMSALAQVLAARGSAVSGSDRQLDAGASEDLFRKLDAAGVRLCAQDGSAVTASTAAVVVSTAIESDNPDIRQAKALGVPIRHRAEALAGQLEGYPGIAVTGTSGKSTVTGMLGWVLECLGADPTVVNGAPVINWRDGDRIGNVRMRRAESPAGPWVVEADESDRSLMNLHPDWAVITNVSRDHFSVEEATALFDRFAAQAAEGAIDMRHTSNGVAAYTPEGAGGGSRFRYRGADFAIALPGRHNAENAVCCAAVCERLGYPGAAVSEALARFAGIGRRLERVGTANGVTVIDDYAHNPAKIEASWAAMAPACERVLAVWRPHGFAPLRALMDDLVTLFRTVVRPDDCLLVLPVYDAGGTADRSVNSDRLVERLHDHKVPAEFVPELDAVPGRLAAEARAGDVVLTMGARDPGLPALARRILAELRG